MHPMMLDPAFAHLPYVDYVEPSAVVVTLAMVNEFGAVVADLEALPS